MRSQVPKTIIDNKTNISTSHISMTSPGQAKVTQQLNFNNANYPKSIIVINKLLEYYTRYGLRVARKDNLQNDLPQEPGSIRFPIAAINTTLFKESYMVVPQAIKRKLKQPKKDIEHLDNK